MKLFTVLPLHKGIPAHDELKPANSYIEVRNGYAFVGDGQYLLVANLLEKFTSELDLEVIDYLNGKLLSKSYWEALFNANTISVVDDLLYLESDGKREFIEYAEPSFIYDPGYQPRDFNKLIAKMDVFAPTVNTSISYSYMEVIQKAFGIKKTERFILSLNGPDKTIKVFVKSRSGIFALVNPHYEDVEDMFYREPLQQFLIDSKKEEVKFAEGRLVAKRNEVKEEPKEDEFNFDED